MESYIMDFLFKLNRRIGLGNSRRSCKHKTVVSALVGKAR